MSKPDREITAWLRQEYGVQRTWIEPGGKHRRICFDYEGVARHVLMGTGPTIKPQSLANRKADIRRELGPPPGPPHKEPRTLEQMMSELRETTATAAPLPTLEEALNDILPEGTNQIWDLRIGAYAAKYGTTLLFSFPHSIVKKFPAGVKIEKLDEENWKFSRGKGPKFVPYYGDRVKLNYYEPKCPVFGSSPGEAVESDGDVLVYCPIATRTVSSKPTPWLKITPEISPEAPMPPPAATPQPLPKVAPMPQEPLLSEIQATPPEPPPAAIVEPGTLEARMRAVIAEVRDIENACPYRLARLAEGRIVWRAPVIE